MAFVAGFASLAAGVVAAYRSPASAAELSIYGATPDLFWAGVGVALLVAVALAFSSSRSRLLAVFLGGLGVFAIVALPLVRSYYFFGAADSLTHLGWVKDIGSGRLPVVDLLYPALHTTSLWLGDLADLSLTRAMLLVTVAYVGVFLVFVPLTARAITRDDRALVFGAFAAFLLLPVNNVSVHVIPHPTSQALFFLPLVLYLLVRYVTATESSRSLGGLLGVALVGIVLVHPQQAVNLLLLFLTVSGLQFLYRRYRPDHPVADHRPLYAQTAFFLVALAIWNSQHERVFEASSGLLETLLHGPPSAAQIAQKGVSLGALGSGLPELFAKMFLVSAVLSLVAGGWLLAAVTGALDDFDPQAAAIGRYLAFGLVPVTGVFTVYLLATRQQMHFRHLGFIMAIVTVVAAVAATHSVDLAAGRRLSAGSLRTVLAAAFAVMLVLSAATVFASPYIYKRSGHVPEAQFDGYDTAFSHQHPDAAIGGIRQGPWRYADALYGTEPTPDSSRYFGVEPETLRSVQSRFDAQLYVVVTRVDWLREVRAWGGLRYSAEDFESLDAQPGVDRVQTNGEVVEYYAP
ncbi:hypothetical protein ACFQH6_08150 [Halobacteriaceae archaeon GCM10025711]